jgi:membrane protease YdiL (CAAX protease family)
MSLLAINPAIGPDTGDPAIGVGSTTPRPWGFWATLACGVIGIASAREGPYALPWCIEYSVRFCNWLQPGHALVWHRGVWWQLAVSGLSGVLLIATSVIAAWASGSPVRQYLGLVRPSRRDLVLGVAILAALLAAGMAFIWFVFQATGGAAVPYRLFANGATATLLLLWPVGVVVAPLSEELMFRGFLFRGWEKTWLGATGTILLTAAFWALLHTNKNWPGVAFTFIAGILLGWLRKRSGSTTLTILLHALVNLIMAVLATMMAIGWIA